MLSEEEKEAIEDIDLFIHCLNYGEMKMTIASERQKEIAQELQMLLNLLNKEQKEIEELKEKNTQLTNYLNDSYYVSADKIKEKIDKYREKLEKLHSQELWNEPEDSIKDFKYNHYLEAYKKLLEEN